jgi:hypothetical protein
MAADDSDIIIAAAAYYYLEDEHNTKKLVPSAKTLLNSRSNKSYIGKVLNHALK